MPKASVLTAALTLGLYSLPAERKHLCCSFCWVLLSLCLQGRIVPLKLRVRWGPCKLADRLLSGWNTCITKTNHPMNTPWFCPCLLCCQEARLHGPNRCCCCTRAESKRSCDILDLLSVVYKNTDTQDHYFFSDVFNNIYTGDQPKPIKLQAAGPGGSCIVVHRIQALSLASGFGKELISRPD